ncbi:MAG: hypothetical protein A3G25_12380 [Betaproteobacteria bacterium RIFCSPLOWO2_12_FULL_63_13]|nr:MAG: hypothetical protein A3G25_12380 [Betaproteobacteria bacterium RIFCSPLOWO2_12_FULL_63_13]
MKGPTMIRTAQVAIVAMLIAGAARMAVAQVFTTPKGEAENVTFEQVGGGVVHIVYDLVASDPRAVFRVTLDASQDRGNTFTVRPVSVSGDVGEGVAPGTGKRIVWESGRDVERLEIDQFRFRISAQAGPLELKPEPSAAPPPPAPTPVVTPPATPQTTAAKPKGGATKWLLIGGGAAAAAGVAAAAGGGSGGGATTTRSTTPPTTPSATNRAPTITRVSLNQVGTILLAATEVIYEVVATDADGDSMTATWNLGGSSATATLTNGQAATTKVWNGAGFAVGTVTVNDGRGGSATESYSSLPLAAVTGVWTGRLANLDIRLNLVQDATSVSGEYVDAFGRTSRVSGTVAHPRVLRFTVAVGPDAASGSPGGTITFTLAGSADLRTFTGATGARDVVTIARQ